MIWGWGRDLVGRWTYKSRAQVGHVDLGVIGLQKAAEAMAVDEIT